METPLLEACLVPEVDAAKLSHHGSKNSTTEEFITALSPTVAFVSVGDSTSCGAGFNQYGNPSQEAISATNAAGVETIYQTERGGVKFEPNAPNSPNPPPPKSCTPTEAARNYGDLEADFVYDTITITTDGGPFFEVCGSECTSYTTLP